MRESITSLCLALLAGGVLWVMARWGEIAAPIPPRPEPAPAPAPEPRPEPAKPRKPRLPWREEGEVQAQAAIAAAPNAPDGTEPEIDYPDDQWMKNIGSRLDGAGMCVFTSFEHTCRWAGLEEFRGFRDWCAQKYPGGGYPEKLQKLIVAYCSAKSIPRERFDPERDVVQIDGPAAQTVTLMEAALRQNLLPCCTLYYSPRYGGRIYHMVNCGHLDADRGAILDNNFRPLEWASRAETIRKMSLNGRVWAVVLLRPGPPPLPKNRGGT